MPSYHLTSASLDQTPTAIGTRWAPVACTQIVPCTSTEYVSTMLRDAFRNPIDYKLDVPVMGHTHVRCEDASSHILPRPEINTLATSQLAQAWGFDPTLYKIRGNVLLYTPHSLDHQKTRVMFDAYSHDPHHSVAIRAYKAKLRTPILTEYGPQPFDQPKYPFLTFALTKSRNVPIPSATPPEASELEQD
jgi:hypothetical protein